MVGDCRAMGGTGIAIDRREAASALRWWLESGVDVAVQESPRNWFARAVDVPEPGPERPDLPETLDSFRAWLASSAEAPLAAPRSKAVLPQGGEGAEVMVVAEPPTREELASGAPIGGEAAELMRRMLGAIGMADSAYVANLACFAPPPGRLSDRQLEQCAAAARRHVALARPKRLLILGDAPSRALLGKPMLEARGHVHKVEGVRTVATFHPRQLLRRASDKALAWKDLLLLVEDEQ